MAIPTWKIRKLEKIRKLLGIEESYTPGSESAMDTALEYLGKELQIQKSTIVSENSLNSLCNGTAGLMQQVGEACIVIGCTGVVLPGKQYCDSCKIKRKKGLLPPLKKSSTKNFSMRTCAEVGCTNRFTPHNVGMRECPIHRLDSTVHNKEKPVMPKGTVKRKFVRRSHAQKVEIVQRINKLRETGSTVDDACAKHSIAPSQYYAYSKLESPSAKHQDIVVAGSLLPTSPVVSNSSLNKVDELIKTINDIDELDLIQSLVMDRMQIVKKSRKAQIESQIADLQMELVKLQEQANKLG